MGPIGVIREGPTPSEVDVTLRSALASVNHEAMYQHRGSFLEEVQEGNKYIETGLGGNHSDAARLSHVDRLNSVIEQGRAQPRYGIHPLRIA